MVSGGIGADALCTFVKIVSGDLQLLISSSFKSSEVSLSHGCMAKQKLSPFVYQFYLYATYPSIQGVQVDLF